ncbi:MAG TPA: homoserine kinase [Chthoniobacterales bacterium]|nr:homoserine kinase [Chthoniobacterales bacterium]
MRQQVTIRVPASTSNLGPGFDCLGVALRLYNFITIGRAKDQTERGRGSDRFGKIVADAAKLFFKRAKQSRFAFSCLATESVPRSRGLGASATIRLAVLHGLNELTGRALDRPAIFQLAAELEGHPDNVAPASFGGFTVVRYQNVQRFQVSSRLKFVLLIPNFEIQTPAARKILPAKISRTAAVESAGNAAAIAAAFASRNYENLRGAFVDQLHQPFRTKLIPFLPRIISAAGKAGALGAFLSGSGSTICAVTRRDPKKVAEAMKRAARTHSRIVITTADNNGIQIRNSQAAFRN